MHRQGAHGAFAIDAVSDSQPGVPAVAAPPDALSKGSYTDRGLFRHDLSPYRIWINDAYASPSRRRGSPHTPAWPAP